MRSTAHQTRVNQTITVDFQNEVTYFQLLGDGKAFVELVVAFILSLGLQLKHKATCHGGGCLTRHSHYVRVRLGRVTRVVKKLEAIFLTAVTPGAMLVSPASLGVLKRIVYRKSFSCGRR